MEEKLKRESRKYLEKLFKQQDFNCAGAVTMDAMKVIVSTMIPDFNQFEELSEIMQAKAKDSKYTVHNKNTNQFEVKYQKQSIDFPSALSIAVYFLKRLERRNTDSFSDRALVRFDDFPTQLLRQKSTEVKKLY